MKKLLLLAIAAFGLNVSAYSQCATTSAPTSNCSFGDQIESFALNSILATGNSGCGASGNNNFTSQTWTLTLGSTYSWSATVGTGLYNQGMGIWIDYNNDGFYSASEFAASSSIALTHNGSLTIPYTATPLTVLKMRVRCRYNNVFTGNDACLIYSYGETEDYTVYLVCPSVAPPAPTITASATSTLICSGATPTLTGSGSLSYTWNPGNINSPTVVVTPGSTTVYSLTASVPACPIIPTSSTSITLSVNTTPTLTVNSGSICSGDSFTINPSGASTYTIEGGSSVVSPASNTSYSVIGTATNGCVSNTVSSSVTVNSNPTITVNSGTICSGSTFTMNPSGASSYTFQGGSSTVSPSSNSTYSVIGSVAGCVSSAVTSSVTVNASPTISVNSGSICSGNSFTMVPSGALTYTFQGGSAVVSPTGNATYSVTGTNSLGCVGATNSSVTVNQNPNVTAVTSATNYICVGQTATLTAGGASTYTWNTTATTSVIAVSPTTTTSYTVTGTDGNGCINSAIVSQSVSACTNINSTSGNLYSTIKVFPNPSNGVFNIQTDGAAQVELFDALGKPVLKTKVEAGTFNLNISDKAKGIYFLKTTSNGQVKTIQLIKE